VQQIQGGGGAISNKYLKGKRQKKSLEKKTEKFNQVVNLVWGGRRSSSVVGRRRRRDRE
jgi:hypothetical protein